jgi:hypothetical protein
MLETLCNNQRLQNSWFFLYKQHQILLSTLFVARKALCLIIYREDVIGHDSAY